jgi:hypothetical protein
MFSNFASFQKVKSSFIFMYRFVFISLIVLIPLLSSAQVDKKYIYNKWFGTIKGHHDTLTLKPVWAIKMELDCPDAQSGFIEFRKDSLILEYSWDDYINDRKTYDFIGRWAWKEDKEGVKLELAAKKNKEIKRLEMIVVYLDKDKLIIANPSEKK